MTDILARLVVRETHGIRRFLYPLTVHLALPDTVYPGWMHIISVQDTSGERVPSLLTTADGQNDSVQRLDFAVSLAPYETRELLLTVGQEPLLVHDPLDFSLTDEGWRNVQSRFALTVDWNGMLRDVVYDTVPHLHGPLVVTRNGSTLQEVSTSGGLFGEELLAAWWETQDEANTARTRWELTACKSWATVTHTVQQPKPGDVITFTLPLTVTALPLLCDFGIGGGVYGKLGAGDTVTWETQFREGPPNPPIMGGEGLNLALPLLGAGGASWTLATNGRTDYAGTVNSREEYHAQQWFHVIDKGKALAVAITHVPDSCRQLTVTLNSDGDVQIAFTLGDTDNNSAAFGVCYHFLNDAPAIAAATNPQSILLPPTVEVIQAPPP